MADFFIKGLIIGFSIAAPVGPIGVLCIRRTLVYGRMSGLLSGLGAATADGFYGLIAGLGLTAVTGVLVGIQPVLKPLGGCFLCYLGLRIFTAPMAESGAEAARTGLISDYVTTLLLTVANPMTILSFSAVFAGLGIAAGTDYSEASALVAGVVSGSSAWWLILCSITSCFSGSFDYRRMTWVNRISGVIVAGFGLAALFVS